MQEIDLTYVESCVAEIGTTEDKVLPILQALQAHYGYLPKPALQHVCKITDITPASITGISTFYDQFRHSPAGKYIVRVCIGTACHVKGAQTVYEGFLRYLNIPQDQDTDADRLWTIERVACLGCCTLAPAVQIGEVTYGHVTGDTVGRVLDDYLRYEEAKTKRHAKKQKPAKEIHDQGEVRVGLGSCCQARGSARLNAAIQQALRQTGIRARLKHVGCVGMCYQTPLMEVVMPDGTSHMYAQVEPADAKDILLRHFKPRGLIRKTGEKISHTLDNILNAGARPPVTRYGIHVREGHVADFLGRQKNIATEHCGAISPTDIDEYIGYGGFEGLRKSVEQLTPEQIIDEIGISGLRGRGGAGFPTHLKWKAVRSQPGDIRYLVCNGDEGDPGAFMDRMLMESYPLRVIEGMAIAAQAVGAEQGFFYIRAEYPLAIQRMTEALNKCTERGFLGDNILNSGRKLHLKIVPGAGAFVCGEESALLQSIMGRRGMPKLRPPYPAQKGLWNKPTLINNVETYALVSWIMRHGGSAFARYGTEKSKGTKVFALAGKIARGGLIEVPMGITIGQIIHEIGGGIGSGLKFKAVQVGGPSGGCIPASLSHVSVDYESLTSVGAMMGSGGLVVLDESDCMVDIARYFLDFTQRQSCGKCTPCRVGTRRMLEILERLCGGQGKEGDIEELEHLARQIKASSLCGLGKTAPNPVLSTIRYFREEYEAHIAGRCPVGKCKALITYSITDECIGCTICAQHCPVDAITMRPYQVHEIDTEKCIRCGACKTVCPADAVKVE
ncbi:MAG: NAD(P)H-dependent oxidoreductase subunit E [Sedimentisphaerales bacterium]|nr:NAD(P)H-dependent oxidoreductase subunit E [Sedimentisphaerales bacterium]